MRDIAARTGLPAAPVDPAEPGLFGALLGAEGPGRIEVDRRWAHAG